MHNEIDDIPIQTQQINLNENLHNVKVVIITTNYSSPKGGSEKLWRELAKSLNDEGHDVVASVYSHQASFHKKILGPNIKVHRRLPSRHGNSLMRKMLQYATKKLLEGRQIRRLIERERPAHVFFSFGGFAELDNPRLLRTITALDTEFSAIFHNNTENYSFQSESISLAQEFCAQAANIYLVSHRIGEIFQRQVGLVDFKYKIIINPMDEPEDFSVTIYDNPLEIVRMAFIGTLDIGVKGLALLLQTIASPSWPYADATLNIFGEGKDRELISNLIKSFGLEDRIFLKGWIDDIDALWNEHHLLVLPSFNEGMPMVIHEAMLRQRIIVATDVGGNSEIIEDGKTGFIAPSASLNHLSNAFIRCFKRRHKWPLIAAAARSSIVKTRQNHLKIQDILSEFNHEQN